MNDVAHLGEAGILERLLPLLGRSGEVEVGPGDDAAVVRLPSDRLIVSTDTMVEGHDFLSDATCPVWIGRKAAVQNLADIAAMGAKPRALVVALSAPPHTPLSTLEQLMKGLAQRAEADGAFVVGGDLGRAEQLTLTVTSLGAVDAGCEPVLRSGARPGDELAIGAPVLGHSAAGLAFVLAGRVQVALDTTEGMPRVQVGGVGDPQLELQAATAVAWHDAPDPDLRLGWMAGCRASAMMDLSDGLVRDGRRLAHASGVDIDLHRSALLPDAEQLRELAAHLGADPWQWVLHGGEEHAMLATFPRGNVPAGFRPIGQVHAPRDKAAPGLTLDGEPVLGLGWDHFEARS